ncbi:phage tail assembly protein [Acetobacter oeni]|uniref:Phage tail protein n=1 Tax=Acetobacter oeni TaxID=304077 RepID=A0A511XP34_9PROT|nr:phage tail assembly protein [Acetobacter oeni]MBB3884492.1 hypothetical protein [Acetobacter oeni]NHO20424.1 hypothetical protein [Acetobacter oeni]GBR00542.1 hypothetical protein AA21952_0138 [Acetobacter oeni LMG 21952]GEN64697.1 hypothetical protein AOE01nite_29210 [Acetobacter oeni]
MRFEPHVLDVPVSHDGGTVTELMVTEPDAIRMANAQRAIDGSINPESASIFSRDLVMAACSVSQKIADMLPLSVTSEIADRVMNAIQDEVDTYEFDPSQDVMTLDEPVQVGPVAYGEISVREPTTGELIKANSNLRQSQGPAAQMRYRMALVSNVSGIPVTSIYKFPASVVMKAAKVIEGFTPAGPGTGSI